VRCTAGACASMARCLVTASRRGSGRSNIWGCDPRSWPASPSHRAVQRVRKVTDNTVGSATCPRSRLSGHPTTCPTVHANCFLQSAIGRRLVAVLQAEPALQFSDTGLQSRNLRLRLDQRNQFFLRRFRLKSIRRTSKGQPPHLAPTWSPLGQLHLLQANRDPDPRPLILNAQDSDSTLKESVLNSPRRSGSRSSAPTPVLIDQMTAG
jgi:hypothetical protein